MRSILAFGLVALFLCVSVGSADLREPRLFQPEERIPPMSARSYFGLYKADEPAQAQVSGIGASCLGLYVFDADGNCVALDDVTTPQSCDELGVQWIANATGRYSVEVRNAGLDMTKYSLAIR